MATNSIVQGEQVPALWPRLLAEGLEIDFAHRSFRWTSEAPGRAAVYVVIVGFSHGGKRPEKLIYDYEQAIVDEPQERTVAHINPYLVDAADAIPVRSRTPLLPVAPIRFGSMPNDGGHLILDEAEREAIEGGDAVAAKYVRELLGADGMLDGGRRWCLWLVNADPADIDASPQLRSRVQGVREHRLASKRNATKELASKPSLFGEIRQPSGPYVCIPRHTSERRSYVPAVIAEETVIAHDSTLTVQSEDLYYFGILQSAMWMAWVRAIGGRLKGDYRISSEMVYNTFPWPDSASGPMRQRVAADARRVLDVRAAHATSTLAILYDPVAMPPDLVAAHADLDRKVDALYGRGAFDDLKRLSLLLQRYDTLSNLVAQR